MFEQIVPQDYGALHLPFGVMEVAPCRDRPAFHGQSPAFACAGFKRLVRWPAESAD